MNEKTIKGSRVTTLWFVMLALFTALSVVATLLIRIPYGLGYINFGDAVVMIAAVVLGPAGGAVAGGLGPAIADAVSGYVIYAPFTAVVKAVEGFLCGLMHTKLFKNRASWVRCLVAFLTVTVWVTLGYALTDFLLVEAYGLRAALAAGVVTMPGTLVQMAVSAAVAMIVSPKLPTLARDKLFRPFDDEEPRT